MSEVAALIKTLPPYGNRKQLIKGQQTVDDIMKEILTCHKLFAGHYDKIALYFNGGSAKQICDRLFSFCKKNIRYKMESEKNQTIKSPAALLQQGYGDCKHFASFIGGVLDAINRTGGAIDWRYRFASYDYFNRTPGHVFIVVDNNGQESWIDPTPGADKTQPVWITDKKIKAMALTRISGTVINGVQQKQLEQAIKTLLKYNAISEEGKVYSGIVYDYFGKIPAAQWSKLLAAHNYVNNAAIGGLFSTIWRGVKKVTLAVPRTAYLSLVSLNFKHFATKLYDATHNADGSYSSGKDKVKTLWQDKLGGDWTVLENTFMRARNKKAFLGSAIGADPVATPAWVATASAIIAAIMPLVNAILKTKQEQTGINYGYDATEVATYGDGAQTQNTGNFSPVLLIGGAALVYLLMKKK